MFQNFTQTSQRLWTFIQTSQIRETLAEPWLLSLTCHFATCSLWLFIPIFFHQKILDDFSQKRRFQWANYILEETTLREFHTIFTTNHHIALKFLGTRLLFHGGTKSYFKVGQIRQLFIEKWDKRYFKVDSYFQVGENVFSKWGSYFKVEKLFQRA